MLFSQDKTEPSTFQMPAWGLGMELEAKGSLENLVFADCSSKSNKNIDILIGENIYYKFIFGNVIQEKVTLMKKLTEG